MSCCLHMHVCICFYRVTTDTKPSLAALLIRVTEGVCGCYAHAGVVPVWGQRLRRLLPASAAYYEVGHCGDN